ncbi:uncharacterized protein MELLADRAFT_91229 [Melampsora larici-populina 98AG31]|uniref:Uncharacterized protein n=1 Tax=Melampsora larici-populina (strain 98AG31 / pathotype 3-4-7) TaxID=747676 RepID=F4RYA6_MELLP|nr:uncharacterized protein MELLADRAFT_91229 [Melampsora larici-populina 98AG31]EGG02643.1 hypothetical protein MELLADRAFT_91229 [Melampsora larici-populina 98AG31]
MDQTGTLSDPNVRPRSKRKPAHDSNPRTKIPPNIHNDRCLALLEDMSPKALTGVLREYRVRIRPGTKIEGLRDLYKKWVFPVQEEAYLPPASTSISSPIHEGASVLGELSATHNDHDPGPSQTWPAHPAESDVGSEQPVAVPKVSGFHHLKKEVLQRLLKDNRIPFSGLRKDKLIELCDQNALTVPTEGTAANSPAINSTAVTCGGSETQVLSEIPPPLERTIKSNRRAPAGKASKQSNIPNVSKKEKSTDSTQGCSSAPSFTVLVQSSSDLNDHHAGSSQTLPIKGSSKQPFDYLASTNPEIREFLAKNGVSTPSRSNKDFLHYKYLEWQSKKSTLDLAECDVGTGQPVNIRKLSVSHPCKKQVLQSLLRENGIPFSGLSKDKLIERCKTNNLTVPNDGAASQSASIQSSLITDSGSKLPVLSDTPPLLESPIKTKCLVPADKVEVPDATANLSKEAKPSNLIQDFEASSSTESSLGYLCESSKSVDQQHGSSAPREEDDAEASIGDSSTSMENVEGSESGGEGSNIDSTRESSKNQRNEVPQQSEKGFTSSTASSKLAEPLVCQTESTKFIEESAKSLDCDPRKPEPGAGAKVHEFDSRNRSTSTQGQGCEASHNQHRGLADVASDLPSPHSLGNSPHVREAKGKSREHNPIPPQASSSSQPQNRGSFSASPGNTDQTASKLDVIMSYLEKLTVGQESAELKTLQTNQSLQNLEISFENMQVEQSDASEKLENLIKTVSKLLDSNEEHHTVSSRRSRPPSGAKNRYTSQGGKLSGAIRLCCATLIGRRAEEETFPEPANEAEKRQWLVDLLKEPAGAQMGRVPGDSPDRPDTHFPFKSGPGHLKASTTQLQTMRTMLLQHGVKRFRPDLSKPYKSVDNSFLWGLAVKIFLRLVEAGEYPGVSLESAPREIVEAEFQLHVTDCLRKRDRNERNLTPTELAAQKRRANKASRLFSLRELRQTTAADTPGLEHLCYIVAQCCSDDELQSEDEDDTGINTAARTKTCEVLDLGWRSEDCESIMLALDNLRKSYRSMAPSTPRGLPSRVRIRPEINNRKKSAMEAPKGLSIDCYRPSFLASRTEVEKAYLKINMVPGLPKYKDILF